MEGNQLVFRPAFLHPHFFACRFSSRVFPLRISEVVQVRGLLQREGAPRGLSGGCLHRMPSEVCREGVFRRPSGGRIKRPGGRLQRSIRRATPEVRREAASKGPSRGRLIRSVERVPLKVCREGASKGQEGGCLQRSEGRVPPEVCWEHASRSQESALSVAQLVARRSSSAENRW